MPLLAPQHKLVLRHLLSRDGTALPSELSTVSGLELEDVLNALDHLHRTDLAAPMPHTPGLGEGRWSLTSHGRQVGPSLAKGEPGSRAQNEDGDPAEGWGFPWRPVKKDPPVYASSLPRPTRENRKGVRRPLFPIQVPDQVPPRRRWGLMALASVVTVVGVVLMLITIRQVDIEIGGIEDGVALQPNSIEGAQISFTVSGANARSSQLLLDDFPVSGVQRYGNRIVWLVPPLTEGDHSLELVVERRLYGQVSRSINFTVDGTPPLIGLPDVLEPVPMDEPVTIAGTSEPGATLVVGGVPIETKDGSFVLELEEPPAGPVSVLAIDRAGNTSTFNMIIPIAYPRTQGVHVSAAAWAHDGLKNSVLDLIRAGKVTAVEISLKNESGVVGYDSSVPLAIASGAADNLFNLREAIEELHALDVRVIGRIVAFRDPVLAK
ncbi:MAG: putative glycoside hydrolase, partial [Actinomycetota bacterium]|nr:putative glycoside hydrolase [Actinomycetota bacterium]